MELKLKLIILAIDESTAASLQTGLANGISLKNLQKSIPDRWVVDELSLDELLLAPLQRTRPTTSRTTGTFLYPYLVIGVSLERGAVIDS